MNRAALAMPPGKVYQDFTHDNYKVGFLGMTGSGKTTLALEKLMREKHEWKIVFDPERQWAQRLGGWAADRLDYMTAALAESGSVCFDPTPLFRSNKVAAFEWFCRWLWEFSGRFKGNKLVILDDFPDFIPKNETKFLQHPVCELFGAGRRRGVDFYCLCRNATEISTHMRGAFSDVYAFKQPDMTCANNVASWGFDAEKLKAMKQLEYFHLQIYRGEITAGRVRIPKRK